MSTHTLAFCHVNMHVRTCVHTPMYSVCSNLSQQDCQEFLRFLLSGLHKDLNSPVSFKDKGKGPNRWTTLCVCVFGSVCLHVFISGYVACSCIVLLESLKILSKNSSSLIFIRPNSFGYYVF